MTIGFGSISQFPRMVPGPARTVGPFRTHNPKTSQSNSSYERCSHFWAFVKQMFKHTFKIWSYIQNNTPNPNTIFKITIYCAKYTQHAKIHLRNPNVSKHLEKVEIFQHFPFFFVIYQITIVHILYILYILYACGDAVPGPAKWWKRDCKQYP